MFKEKRLQAVRATEKALDLLDVLAQGSEELQIGSLAAKLGIGRNEVLLLLVTLECRGLVEWDDRRRRYGPGWKAEELAKMLMEEHSSHCRSQASPSPFRGILPT